MAGVGFYFAGAVLLPILGGVGLDSVFHTSPVFVLIGLFVGLAAGALDRAPPLVGASGPCAAGVPHSS